MTLFVIVITVTLTGPQHAAENVEFFMIPNHSQVYQTVYVAFYYDEHYC